jgi:hypothetical protein
MARDKITMAYGVDDTSVSASKATVTPVTIAPANGAVVDGFFKAKDNSAYLLLVITTAGSLILKKGNAYPTNNILGDLEISVDAGTHLITVERSGRFENKDGSLNIDFKTGTAGTIAAFGKQAGLR